MKMISTALKMYKIDCGEYPISLDELIPRSDRVNSCERESYISELPIDPWGRVYNYSLNPVGEYELASFGKDLIAGTEDDIVLGSQSWKEYYGDVCGRAYTYLMLYTILPPILIFILAVVIFYKAIGWLIKKYE